MKRAAGILLIAILIAGLGGSVFAANGDTLNIGGVVPLSLDLTVTADPSADNLPLVGVSGPTTEPIATIDISTNNHLGWELWVFSANAGVAGTSMNNADGNSIGYTINYQGLGTLGATALTDSGLKVGEAGTNATETGQVLEITYNQEPDHPAGYYSDQLTVVLRAK
jgi:hypothetical protein